MSEMQSGGRTRSVLVAEDNEAHRMVLRRVMRDVEKTSSVVLDLKFVGSGNDLLEDLQSAAAQARGNPDVILLDLHMPGLSGMETLRELFRDERLRTIPVVVLTSSDQRHHVDEAYRNGANAYLVKLGDYDALVSQMRHFAGFWLESALLPKVATT